MTVLGLSLVAIAGYAFVRMSQVPDPKFHFILFIISAIGGMILI